MSSLSDLLNNDDEPWRVVYTAPEQMQRAQILTRSAELEVAMVDTLNEISARIEKIADQVEVR